MGKNKIEVYLVICPEMGWDNVVGIYNKEYTDVERLQEEFPDDQYVINERTIE